MLPQSVKETREKNKSLGGSVSRQCGDIIREKSRATRGVSRRKRVLKIGPEMKQLLTLGAQQ